MNQSKNIAYLDTYMDSSGRVYQHEFFRERLERVPLYELEQHSLESYEALIIPNNIDEEFLYKHRGRVADFLDLGRIVISFAQTFLPWLPNKTLWQRSPLSINARTVLVNTEHLIFKGVTEYDLNYRRGVKGFFSRGYFDAPEGAEVVLKDNEGATVVYIDRSTTKGTILAGAGTDLLGYGLGDTTTARRIGLQLIDWIDAERRANGR
ncbi:aspartate/tyrosine/aromatic aminotransferase [Paenibacillus sp. RC67]|uniref:aspartate/tyrosine/aromatic aminotransferase n=1 Tax=Paenibacillus sp. RC67 TaxID=3039392 RepID=UPI0024ACFFC1|nr:aspartate/tyrosine/aromatic aminotransferase [Paenibacillus sp. RC67]